MNKTILLASAALLLCGAGLIYLALFLTPGKTEAVRPNVVLIVIDTLRADRIHATRNGKAVMPNLAALADEGAEFTHAVAQCSWTRSSIASIIAGVYVDLHQVYYSVEQENLESPSSDILSPNWITLAEYMSGNSYDNLAFVTNGNVTSSFGFSQGYSPERFIFGNNVKAQEVTERLLKESQSLKEPYFVYAHYMDPHVLYDPPAPLLDTFGKLPEITPEDKPIFDDFLAYYLEIVDIKLGLEKSPKFPAISAAGMERVLTLYDIECHYADMEVGRLIYEMRKKNPNTIFVITSDHGEEFWERDAMGHGTTLFEEQAHVPLIVLGGGIMPLKKSNSVELLGLAPTLSNLLNLPPLNTWQGRDWFANGAGRDDGLSFSRTLGGWKKYNVDLEAVWFGKWKVIRDNARGILSAYDLKADNKEQTDLGDMQSEIISKGKDALDRHHEKNIGARSQDIAPIQSEINPALLEQLKNLGYFGDDPQGKNEDGAEADKILEGK